MAGRDLLVVVVLLLLVMLLEQLLIGGRRLDGGHANVARLATSRGVRVRCAAVAGATADTRRPAHALIGGRR